MNAAEVNVLLTKAALLDPRMKRVDPVDQADMAEAWAAVLVDVSLVDALAALPLHYRVSREPLMPADVVRLVDEGRPEVRVLSPRDAWLINLGVDPDEFESAVAAGEETPRAIARLSGIPLPELTMLFARQVTS